MRNGAIFFLYRNSRFNDAGNRSLSTAFFFNNITKFVSWGSTNRIFVTLLILNITGHNHHNTPYFPHLRDCNSTNKKGGCCLGEVNFVQPSIPRRPGKTADCLRSRCYTHSVAESPHFKQRSFPFQSFAASSHINSIFC